MSLRFEIILIGMATIERTRQLTLTPPKVLLQKAFTQTYLDCAWGSRTPLFKPVFTRSEVNVAIINR